MIVLEDSALFAGLVSFFLISVRLSAMMLAAPFFSAATISVPMRVALALGLAVILTAKIKTPTTDLLSVPGFLVVMQEVLIGTAIGFVLQLAFAAVAMAGEQISFATGLGFAAMIDPQTGSQSPVVTQFLSIFLIMIFLSTEGHHLLVRQVAASFDVLPIGAPILDPKIFTAILQDAGLIFSSSFLISLPIVVSLFIMNLTLGMLARVAPALNIFSIGFSITILIGIALIMVTMPNIGAAISGTLENVSQRMRELALVGSGK